MKRASGATKPPEPGISRKAARHTGVSMPSAVSLEEIPAPTAIWIEINEVEHAPLHRPTTGRGRSMADAASTSANGVGGNAIIAYLSR